MIINKDIPDNIRETLFKVIPEVMQTGNNPDMFIFLGVRANCLTPNTNETSTHPNLHSF